MKYLSLTIVLLILSVATAQDITTESKAFLLIGKLHEKHVKPVAEDAAFGRNVCDRMIEMLDVQHFIFSAEDIAKLRLAAEKLPDEIKGKKGDFLAAFRKCYNDRINQLRKSMQVFRTQPVNLDSREVFELSSLDKPVTATMLEGRFRNLLSYHVISDMTSGLGKDAFTIPADSVSAIEQASRKKTCEFYEEFFNESLSGNLIDELYLSGITLAFDPHSYYFSPGDKQLFEQELSSEREIYGINFSRNSQQMIVLSDIQPGSAAWLSGELHEGDIIVAIQFAEKEKVTVEGSGKSVNDIHELFRNSLTDQVALTVKNETGATRTVLLTKAAVYSDTDVIKNAVLKGEKKIGYIALPDFYVNWTDTSGLGCANDVAKCVLKLKKENIDGLILDLRGNGGGSLKEAVDLTGIFIDYGPVVAIKDKNGEVGVMKDFNRGSIYSGPFIIMMDGQSASASEVVAGALQDYNKALIVGTTSFGKATSQSIETLDPAINPFSRGVVQENPDYGYANITNGILYRITKDWNQNRGVIPDVELQSERFEEDEEQQREKDLANAIQPDSISKRIIFTPSAKLPVERLKTASGARMNSMDAFVIQKKLENELKEIIASYDKSGLNLKMQLELRQTILEKLQKMEEFYDSVSPGFEPESNSFDAPVYEANSILKTYNDNFLAGLRKDIGLMETVNIMNDMISEIK